MAKDMWTPRVTFPFCKSSTHFHRLKPPRDPNSREISYFPTCQQPSYNSHFMLEKRSVTQEMLGTCSALGWQGEPMPSHSSFLTLSVVPGLSPPLAVKGSDPGWAAAHPLVFYFTPGPSRGCRACPGLSDLALMLPQRI